MLWGLWVSGLALWGLASCGTKAGGDSGAQGVTDDDGGDTDDSDDGDDTSDGDTDVPPVDADGDGHPEDDDCDDTDSAIYPGAEELCDGVDQDCNGLIDDGVPSDGAGCVPAEEPVFADTIDTLHVEIRTGTGGFDGTNSAQRLCLNADVCVDLLHDQWNDLEPGNVDVYMVEGLNLPRDQVDRVRLETSTGSDLWRPTCVALRFDGEPVHCHDGLEVEIGSDSGESPSWDDPLGLGADTCNTCFDDTVTVGPILGAPTNDGANVWVRADASRPVTLRVASSAAGLAAAPAVSSQVPSAEDDFTVVLPIQGLGAGQTWAYDLEIDGERHGPWTLKTPPVERAPSLWRLAFGSCAKDDAQPIFGHVLASAPDLMLFIGDNHYGNTDELGDLRQYYRHAHARALRADLMTRTATIATWDDHDYVGNNTDGTASGKDVALRVFQEYWANGSYGAESVPGVFSVQHYADVDIFLLDDRYWRGLDGSVLGDAQEAWLLQALGESTATFKLLASGSQFTPHGSSDSWSAYPEAWDRFRQDLVDDAIEGVVLLSGDIHSSELRLLEGGPGGYDLPELTSSPLATWNGSCGDEADVRACVNDGHFFMTVDFDTTLADPSLSATIVDGVGVARAEWTILRSELTYAR